MPMASSRAAKRPYRVWANCISSDFVSTPVMRATTDITTLPLKRPSVPASVVSSPAHAPQPHAVFTIRT